MLRDTQNYMVRLWFESPSWQCLEHSSPSIHSPGHQLSTHMVLHHELELSVPAGSATPCPLSWGCARGRGGGGVPVVPAPE